MSSSSQQQQEVNHRNSTHPSDASGFPFDSEDSAQPNQVPELSSLLPAIFIPLKQDLLRPIEPAQDRIELLQRMQVSIEANEKAVRNNLIWMMEREARRRLDEGRRNGFLAEPHQPKPIDWGEGDELLTSLETRADPNQTYYFSSAALDEMKCRIKPNYAGIEQVSPHERVARDLLMVVHSGANDIEAYSKRHIKEIRDQINASLGREKENENLEMFVSQ